MGSRRSTAFLMSLTLAACSEANEREVVTGPEFARPAPPAGSCDPASLPRLVRDYFPGSRQTPIVNLANALGAAPRTEAGRDAGFEVMDSVGYLSRDLSVSTDPAKGAALTVALVNCMFANATTSADDFTKALTRAEGGAYYVRGGGGPEPDYEDPEGRTDPVIGTDYVSEATPTNLSGVKPAENQTWTAVLDTNDASEGRALFYGYKLPDSQLAYEWKTVPAGAVFDPGVIVSVCDGSGSSLDAMVFEANVGVLAYVEDDMCDDTQSMTLRDGGWGPRALAGRLARVMLDAVTPAPLQAATVLAFKSGSGGTATTFKSKFQTEAVTTVGLGFGPVPRNIKVNTNVTILVLATTAVSSGTEGVNGVCIYLTGENNNGQNTGLVGAKECEKTPEDGVSALTRSRNDVAGYAEFTFKVTKTGGLNLIATSTDDSGATGVVGRDGQTFGTDVVKINVKP